MHLAELNIARLKYPFDDPRIAEFADNLDSINALADRSEGFVWRMIDENGDAGLRAFDDALVMPNMSVWESPEHLERFVWNTVHKRFYRKRAEWFGLMRSQHFVMWWIEPGHLPDLMEAKARLDHLRAHSGSDFAFGWSHLPHVKLWQQARCA